MRYAEPERSTTVEKVARRFCKNERLLSPGRPRSRLLGLLRDGIVAVRSAVSLVLFLVRTDHGLAERVRVVLWRGLLRCAWIHGCSPRERRAIHVPCVQVTITDEERSRDPAVPVACARP